MPIFIVEFTVEAIEAKTPKQAARQALERMNELLARGDGICAQVIEQDDEANEPTQVVFKRKIL